MVREPPERHRPRRFGAFIPVVAAAFGILLILIGAQIEQPPSPEYMATQATVLEIDTKQHWVEASKGFSDPSGVILEVRVDWTTMQGTTRQKVFKYGPYYDYGLLVVEEPQEPPAGFDLEIGDTITVYYDTSPGGSGDAHRSLPERPSTPRTGYMLVGIALTVMGAILAATGPRLDNG